MPFVLLLLILLLPTARHGLYVKATWQAGELKVEAFYDDDTPAIRAKVVVLDEQGQTLASGVTNEQGVWKQAWRQAGKLTLRCDAGDGHRAVTTLEVSAAAASLPTAAASTTPAAPQVAHDPQPSREELTAVPWAKAALGLVLIAFLAVAAKQILRRRSGPPSTTT